MAALDQRKRFGLWGILSVRESGSDARTKVEFYAAKICRLLQIYTLRPLRLEI